VGRRLLSSRTLSASRMRAMGDTVDRQWRVRLRPLPGFEAIKPMVFAGLFPAACRMITNRCATRSENCNLNDAAFFYEPENSVALGFGFRCGFLGLLHMEICAGAAGEREFGLNLIPRRRACAYRTYARDGRSHGSRQPREISEPERTSRKSKSRSLKAMIITNEDSVGGILQLCQEKRGTQKNFEYLSPTRVIAHLRTSSERDRARFLRSAKIHFTRLRFARLSSRRIRRNPTSSNWTCWSRARIPVDALALIIHREFAVRARRALISA